MAVEYCHRGDHLVDLDYNCEGTYLFEEPSDFIARRWCCWDHLTAEEQEKLEKDGE